MYYYIKLFCRGQGFVCSREVAALKIAFFIMSLRAAGCPFKGILLPLRLTLIFSLTVTATSKGRHEGLLRSQ